MVPHNLHSDSEFSRSGVTVSDNVFMSGPVEAVSKHSVAVQRMETVQAGQPPPPLEARMYTADESGTITLHQPEPGAATQTVSQFPSAGPGASIVMGEAGAGDMVTLQVESGDLGLVMNQLNIKLDTPALPAQPAEVTAPGPPPVSEEAPVVTERPVLSGHTVMETLVRHNTPAMNKDNSLTSITAPGFR